MTSNNNQHKPPADTNSGQQKAPVDLGRSKIVEQYHYQQQNEDDEFQKLMQRHNEEKQKVNTFESNADVKNQTVNESYQQDVDRTLQDEIYGNYPEDIESKNNNNSTYNYNDNNLSTVQLEDNLITT